MTKLLLILSNDLIIPWSSFKSLIYEAFPMNSHLLKVDFSKQKLVK